MGGVLGILSCYAIGGDACVFDVQFTSETEEKYGRENSPPFEQASKLLKSQSSGDRGLSKGQERCGIELGPADPQQQSRFLPWRRRPSHRRIASLRLQHGSSDGTASSYGGSQRCSTRSDCARGQRNSGSRRSIAETQDSGRYVGERREADRSVHAYEGRDERKRGTNPSSGTGFRTSRPCNRVCQRKVAR